MGWWSIGTGTDEVIGDDSADAVAETLTQLNQQSAKAPEPALTVQELLNALAAVLHSNPGFVFSKLMAKLSDGQSVESTGHDEPLVDTDTLNSLQNGIRTVTDIYWESFARMPTLREILENFSFVLGYRPGRYLSHFSDKELQEISAVRN